MMGSLQPEPVRHGRRDDPPSFFRSAGRQFVAYGGGASLPGGPIETLDRRVRDFFAARTGSPALLLGAVPFERSRSAHLVQPETVVEGAMPPPAVPSTGSSRSRWSVTSEPSASGYASMVSRALDLLGRDGLEKVVLARRLLVEADRPLDPFHLVTRLARDPSVTTFALPLPGDGGGTTPMLVGGTPELLLARSGRRIRSNPLAGSARRQADATADRAAATALERSDKNRREHAAVVEAILDTLAPYCAELATPAAAALQSTESMWHLGTQIEGRLRDDDVSCAQLLAQLHPTPAVCGLPRPQARALIDTLEPFDRGFYAGAVGWLDNAGDGEWHIALRCGEISGRRVTLYAGAGIVAGSDPMAEAAETSAKFVALLQALGIDENGRPLEGGA